MVDCKKKTIVILVLNCNVYPNDVIKTGAICDVFVYKSSRRTEAGDIINSKNVVHPQTSTPKSDEASASVRPKLPSSTNIVRDLDKTIQELTIQNKILEHDLLAKQHELLVAKKTSGGETQTFTSSRTKAKDNSKKLKTLKLPSLNELQDKDKVGKQAKELTRQLLNQSSSSSDDSDSTSSNDNDEYKDKVQIKGNDLPYLMFKDKQKRTAVSGEERAAKDRVKYDVPWPHEHAQTRSANEADVLSNICDFSPCASLGESSSVGLNLTDVYYCGNACSEKTSPVFTSVSIYENDSYLLQPLLCSTDFDTVVKDNNYTNYNVVDETNNVLLASSICPWFTKTAGSIEFEYSPDMSGNILKNVSIRFCEMDMNNFSRVHEAVFYSGKPNFAYCKIPVRSNFNIQLWEQLLEDYHDKIVFEFLKYGWPLNYVKDTLSDPPTRRQNHLSQFSIPKGDSNRRVIVDCSHGNTLSINEGIPSDTFLNENFKLYYPRHEEFIALLLNHGRGCAIWKLDLSRAFRQLVLDPHDLHLQGYERREQIFIDNRLIFGMRSSPQACQRTTNAVSYMLWKSNIHIINYVDDFGGVSDNQNAEYDYNFVLELFRRLGLEVSKEKCLPPTKVLTFLGKDI
ncbi:unnamed protein product [Mytilus coruscus]|uniref:Reverse transcriptase domain-containing protein n=1 Tax=Mytilus coruscus TaxID=42192 RepID=A0A6J8DHX1_MYTCO|nr:unnamed protein product [Mytilus coruscus]